MASNVLTMMLMRSLTLSTVGFSICLGLLTPSLPAWAEKVEVSQPKLYGDSLDAARRALEEYAAHDDSAEFQRVTEIGYRLAKSADWREFPFSFYLIDMPEPNAFALPGGQIFVTRGMLKLGLSDDMLACLLGHEIAHVIHHHGTRMQRRATLLSVLGQILTLGVLIGADDRPENPLDPYGIDRSESRKGSLVQGAAAASMVLGELLLRNYSREFEDEADESGQRLAAAAGFAPAGAQQLWELMTARIPQSKDYGYWRTHPFSDQRMRAARVRAAEFTVREARPVTEFRQATQQAMLDFGARPGTAPEQLAFLEQSALSAWPAGEPAEALRLKQLHERRKSELAKPETERDYGALIVAYRAQLEQVRALTPNSSFLAAAEGELAELQAETEKIYPNALAIWDSGLYQTPFLEVFLSNYPTAQAASKVALALGDAYSRLGRQADAVTQYLRASAGPDPEVAQRASLGLRNLAPFLTELVALQELREQSTNAELKASADQRLGELATTFTELKVGADYLRQYPEGEHAAVVVERLEVLAQNLYGEVVLYQGIGDHVKALDRIQQILTHAPTSKAAAMLRERAVVKS